MKRLCAQEKSCEHNCPCDCREHPRPLKIVAGLETIPRQIATFPDWRAALLASIHDHSALLDWRARSQDDFGIMLLEMWAYVLDVQAFYDETIAHELYLRTARRRESLRRLVQLLGYRPKPAVAASVPLALLADGRRTVSLPAGLAFRSGAFDGEPPQVFELAAATAIHPLANRWTMPGPRPTTLGTANPACLLLEVGSANVEEGQAVLLRDTATGTAQAAVVSAVGAYTAADGATYTRLDFPAPLALAADTAVADLRLERPTQTAALWGDTASASTLTLDAQYRQIRPGARILVENDGAYRWFQVTAVSDVSRAATADSTMTINGHSYTMPGVTVRVTQLTLDANLNAPGRKGPGQSNWDAASSPLYVHHEMVRAGTVTVAARTTLAPADPLLVAGRPETPADDYDPADFLLEDLNERGVAVEGRFDFEAGALTLDQGESWSPPLATPAELYGNVVTASRGETVADEVLGSGDATQANQTFELKKGPLTYVASPTAGNEQGVASTLQVWVGGVRWREVPSFFGVAPDAEVYVVRQNDDEETLVTFGDGVRGARLPTGSDNVVATYRHGAGKASPPAGSITQIARPVKGLTGVRNPVAAAGGADRESQESVQAHAPASALILGRAVSMADMAAVAAGVPGVRAVQAEWRWNAVRQRPVVQIWIIGAASIADQVAQTLRNLADPATPIDVVAASGVPATLALDVQVDARYLTDEVLDDVRDALLAKEEGLLVPERIGIGTPLYRSVILAEVMAVEGVEAVTDVTWNGTPFPDYAVTPGAGNYFDLEEGDLLLNGAGNDDG